MQDLTVGLVGGTLSWAWCHSVWMCVDGTQIVYSWYAFDFVISAWLCMALLYLVRSSIVPPLNAGLEGTHHERHMGFWGTSGCDRWSDRVHNLPCRQCWLDGWPRHTRHVTWWQYQVSTLSKSVSVRHPLLWQVPQCCRLCSSGNELIHSILAYRASATTCRLPSFATCLHCRFRPEPHSREAYRTFLSTHPRILDWAPREQAGQQLIG